jgi:uncharacterized membrane protein
MMLFSSKQIEGVIFRFGCILFVVQAIILIVLSVFDTVFAAQIIAVMTASTFGGRMASVLTGLGFGMHSVFLILLLCVFNISWLFFFFPLIVTFSHHMMIKLKLVGKMLDSTKKTAERQKERITKYGTWGVALFIWLPLPWTGSLIGAVIGFLIGLSIIRTTVIAASSVVLSVVSWVFGFKYLFLFTGDTGKIIAILILGTMLSFSLYFRVRSA